MRTAPFGCGVWGASADLGEAVVGLVIDLSVDAEVGHIVEVIIPRDLAVCIGGLRTALVDEREDFVLLGFGSEPTIKEVLGLDVGVLREVHPHIDLAVVLNGLSEVPPHTPTQRFFPPFVLRQRIAVFIATPIGSIEQDTACSGAFLHPTEVGVVGLSHRGCRDGHERNESGADRIVESGNESKEEGVNDISHKPISD